MKCTIPEISWHNRDPVLSIDLQPFKNLSSSSPCRLATGGTDSHVVIWYMSLKENGLATVEVAADLQRHQRAVNTVRFSPSGQFLASGDDESAIIVWKQKTDQDAPEFPTDGENSKEQKEQWITMKILRGHLEDVYDLSWSSDSCCLISGSIDNTAILWDVQKGRSTTILSGHSGFVQGVTWDPKNQFVATLSSDRTCRIYNVTSKKLVSKICKAALPVPKDSEVHGKAMRLYHDDTLKSFFRRLEFSPDGQLLVTPAGVIEIPNSDKQINATYIFTRGDFSRPVVYLPSPVQYTVAVRFCPLLFKLREGSSLFALPYRMVFAVATKSNVLVYDTQQPDPISIISNIHYTRLTDLSWSSDARILVASSTDGYCSIITFCPGELGEEYMPSEEPVEVGSNQQKEKTGSAPDEKGETSAKSVGDQSTKESTENNDKEISTDLGESQKIPKDNDNVNSPASTSTTLSSMEISTDVRESSDVSSSAATTTSTTSCTTPTNRPKAVKRITPITLSRRPLVKDKGDSPATSPSRVVENSGKSDSSMSIDTITHETSMKKTSETQSTSDVDSTKQPAQLKKENIDTQMNDEAEGCKEQFVSKEEDKMEEVPEHSPTDNSKTTKDNREVDDEIVLDEKQKELSVKTTEKHSSPGPDEGAKTLIEATGEITEHAGNKSVESDERVEKTAEATEKKIEGEVHKSVTSLEPGEPMDVDDEVVCEQSSAKDAGDSSLVADSKASNEKPSGSAGAALSDGECSGELKMDTQSPSRKELLKIHQTTPSKIRPTSKGDGAKQSEALCQNSPGSALSPGLPRTVTPIENRTPRRVKLITIASPKSKKKLL